MVRQFTQSFTNLTEIINQLELEKVEAIVRKQGPSRLQEDAAHRWNVNDQVLLGSEGSRVPLPCDHNGTEICVLLLEWHDDKVKWKVCTLDSLEEAWFCQSNLIAWPRLPI